MDFGSKLAAGLTYDDFLARHGTSEHLRRWQGVYDTVRLSKDQRSLLEGFKREMHVLCLAGAWCGDCVDQCPIFERFARASGRIQLRFFDRDAHPDLAAALRICGGARVPVVAFLSEDNHLVSWLGDRTLSKYRQVAAQLQGAACPTGLVTDKPLLEAVTQDWLNEFERVQLILRTSGRLRQLHRD